MRIRAHHLLCMQGFQGYGYSNDFADNMTAIIKNMKSNPTLEIVDECDVICSSCPHNIGKKCLAYPAQNAKKIDIQTLKKLNLKNGAKIKAQDVFLRVNKKIKTTSDTIDICGNCNWKEKCLFFISLKKN
ncbi:MAG: DUF1284 domain-containing protein [Candidatus Methanofastidiosia archaeon]